MTRRVSECWATWPTSTVALALPQGPSNLTLQAANASVAATQQPHCFHEITIYPLAREGAAGPCGPSPASSSSERPGVSWYPVAHSIPSHPKRNLIGCPAASQCGPSPETSERGIMVPGPGGTFTKPTTKLEIGWLSESVETVTAPRTAGPADSCLCTRNILFKLTRMSIEKSF
jgi:hypothetical protein